MDLGKCVLGQREVNGRVRGRWCWLGACFQDGGTGPSPVPRSSGTRHRLGAIERWVYLRWLFRIGRRLNIGPPLVEGVLVKEGVHDTVRARCRCICAVMWRRARGARVGM